MRIRIGDRVISLSCSLKSFKVKDVVGLRSGFQTHHILLDFDSKNQMVELDVMNYIDDRWKGEHVRYYPTPNGFHVIVFKRHSFRRAVREMILTPHVDLMHVAMGMRRGYWYLDTWGKTGFDLPEGLEKNLNWMKIERVVNGET